MLNLSELKQTRFYQEVKQEGVEEGKEEGKIEAIPRMITFGLNPETIAQLLGLPLEVVRQEVTRLQRQLMSFSEQNIDTFIELLTQQRSLFSAEQLTELAQLIEPLPDEIESLSNAIATWIETHLDIAEAQAKLLEGCSRDSASESLEENRDRSNLNLNKETLKNAIEPSCASDDSSSVLDN